MSRIGNGVVADPFCGCWGHGTGNPGGRDRRGAATGRDVDHTPVPYIIL